VDLCAITGMRTENKIFTCKSGKNMAKRFKIASDNLCWLTSCCTDSLSLSETDQCFIVSRETSVLAHDLWHAASLKAAAQQVV